MGRLGKVALSLVLTIVLGLGLIARGQANTINLTFTGVNGTSQGGVDVGPYYAKVNGGRTTTIYCDDFFHHVDFGEHWSANVNTFADLRKVRFATGSASQTLQEYGAIAWLIGQMRSHPTEYGDIDFAIWAITTPPVTSQSAFTAGSQSWLNLATSQTYTASQFKHFEILTPIDPGAGSSQEMLRGTPEPATLVLFGGGVALVAVLISYCGDLNAI